MTLTSVNDDPEFWSPCMECGKQPDECLCPPLGYGVDGSTSHSLLDKPMARIATGWRMRYLPTSMWWAVFNIEDRRNPLLLHSADKAKAEYMRLTQVSS